MSTKIQSFPVNLNLGSHNTMKKTNLKKLDLSKKTVANLNKQELNDVKGGNVTHYCGTGDNCTFGCGGPAYTPYTICC